MEKSQQAAYITTSAILGLDIETAMVGGKHYCIEPPTIRKIAGAAYHLSQFDISQPMHQLLTSQDAMMCGAHALSWLISGNDGLTEELSNGTPEEIAEAIEKAYRLVDVSGFLKLSALAKNVTKMTAASRL